MSNLFSLIFVSQSNVSVAMVFLYALIFCVFIVIGIVSKKIKQKEKMKKMIVSERNKIIEYALKNSGNISLAEAYSISSLDNEQVKELLETLTSEAVCSMNVSNEGVVYYVFKRSGDIKHHN